MAYIPLDPQPVSYGACFPLLDSSDRAFKVAAAYILDAVGEMRGR